MSIKVKELKLICLLQSFLPLFIVLCCFLQGLDVCHDVETTSQDNERWDWYAFRTGLFSCMNHMAPYPW